MICPVKRIGVEIGGRKPAHELVQPDSPSLTTDSTSVSLGTSNLNPAEADHKLLESTGEGLTLVDMTFIPTPPGLFYHDRVSHVVTVKGDTVMTAFQQVETIEPIPSNSLDGRIDAG